jgi:hypothetical protein
MHNNFGFSSKSSANDSKRLFNGNKEVGNVTFLGNIMKKFTRTDTKVTYEEQKALLTSGVKPKLIGKR